MESKCYINNLPEELLDIIYIKSNKLYCKREWENSVMYSFIYDTSLQHRKNRTKKIYKYDYFLKQWVYWCDI